MSGTAGPAGAGPARRRLGLGARILIGMIVGAAAGALIGKPITRIEPIGEMFIRLLVLAAVPLVFFNLLAGLTALTDMRTFGRLAFRIVVYYTLTTVLALVLGLVAMSLIQPGRGVQLTGAVDQAVGAVPSLGGVIMDLIPTNVVQAFADGKVAQIVVVSVLLGITTLLLPAQPRDRLRAGYALVAELFRRLVDVILFVAPVGIGALMAVTVGRYGAELFGPLARFLLGVWAAQLAMVGVYMTLLRTLTDRAPLRFLRETATLWATTASTTSSLASLSVALEQAERIGLPRSVYAFTLPLGAQINKDGTSIMLTAVLLFTAQAAGVDFTIAQMLTILVIGLILSEGSAGIPGGGLVIALIFVQAFSLPLEIAAIIGGIYRLVDMGNTTINVMGDMVGTAIVAHAEARRGAIPTTS